MIKDTVTVVYDTVVGVMPPLVIRAKVIANALVVAAKEESVYEPVKSTIYEVITNLYQ